LTKFPDGRDDSGANVLPLRRKQRLSALMATAPRSSAGVVANAPLKLPTGVRAALTMTHHLTWLFPWLEVVGEHNELRPFTQFDFSLT
jgi:hypothetical protein